MRKTMISTVKANILVNYKTINSRLALGDFKQARMDPVIKSLIGILTTSQVSDHYQRFYLFTVFYCCTLISMFLTFWTSSSLLSRRFAALNWHF